jgi:hypothetical protein
MVVKMQGHIVYEADDANIVCAFFKAYQTDIQYPLKERNGRIISMGQVIN